jgi:hypothetical protein
MTEDEFIAWARRTAEAAGMSLNDYVGALADPPERLS